MVEKLVSRNPCYYETDRDPLTGKCYVWSQVKSRRASHLLHSPEPMGVDDDVIGVTPGSDGNI